MQGLRWTITRSRPTHDFYLLLYHHLLLWSHLLLWDHLPSHNLLWANLLWNDWLLLSKHLLLWDHRLWSHWLLWKQSIRKISILSDGSISADGVGIHHHRLTAGQGATWTANDTSSINAARVDAARGANDNFSTAGRDASRGAIAYSSHSHPNAQIPRHPHFGSDDFSFEDVHSEATEHNDQITITYNPAINQPRSVFFLGNQIVRKYFIRVCIWLNQAHQR